MSATDFASRPTRLALTVNPARLAPLHAACRRSDTFDVGEPQPGCALVTDDSAKALRHAASGDYVLFPDPFFAKADERQAMADSRRVMPLLTARCATAVQRIHESLVEGRLGEPGLLRIHHWERETVTAPSSLPLWLDVATWLFSNSPNTVYAIERPNLIQTHLGFAGGGMAVIDVDRIAGQSGYFSLTLIGSDGAAYADDHHNSHLLLRDDGATHCVSGQLDMDLRKTLNEFSNAIHDQKELSGLWDDIESVIALQSLALQSADSQQMAHTGASDA